MRSPTSHVVTSCERMICYPLAC